MTSPKQKSGILLVAFGTSIASAQTAYHTIEKAVRTAFPNIDIFWAYTSVIVRRKLESEGTTIPSPLSALALMADKGYTHVAIQSLHVIPGIEYHQLLELAKAVEGLPKGIKRITVGTPLLFSHNDMLEATTALAQWSRTFRQDNEAVVLMGHGTPHQANVYYPALQQYLQQADTNLYLGTLDGFPSFNDVEEKLLLANVKKAWLVPFLTVAGDHATKDMTGSGDDTWEKQLQRKGIETKAVMSGLGQLDSMVAIWLKHLQIAIEALH